MPSPSTALASLRPDIGASFTEFDLEMNQRGFISHKIFPVRDVPAVSGTYGVIPLAELLKPAETERSPGGGYNRQEWAFTEASWRCREHGQEQKVDSREQSMYRTYFDLEQVSMQRAFDIVLRNQELRVKDLLYNATTFTSHTTAITHEWDDADNAVPIDDIETGMNAMFAACGRYPTTLVCNRKQFNGARNTAQVIDRVKSSGHQDPRPGKISTTDLAACLGIAEVLVAESAYNTAAEGQTASLAPIWSDEYMSLIIRAQTQDIQEVCAGRIFHYAEDGSKVGGHFESYRDEVVRGDIMRVRHDVHEKIMYVPAGHLFSNAITI